MNSIIRDNFLSSVRIRIEKSGEIVESYIRNILISKKQNIVAFGSISELNNAIDTDLTFKVPIILRNYLRDYGFDAVQLYDMEGDLLGEAGKSITYESRSRLKYFRDQKSFAGIFVLENQFYFIVMSTIANEKAMLVGKSILNDKTVGQIQETIGVSLSILYNGKIMAKTKAL